MQSNDGFKVGKLFRMGKLFGILHDYGNER